MPTLTPPMKYFGGKHYLADWIIGHFPPHTSYIEPFFGGGAVLLAKNPDGVSEVVNDIDSDLTAFWRTLQDEQQFDRFRRRVEATPFSENDWRAAMAMSDFPPADDWLRAWGFFVRCRQSLSGRMESFASVSTSRTRRRMNEQVSAWLTCVEGLPAVHARLKRVLILNRPAVDVIRQFDKEGVVQYLDPTYLPETRTSKDVYRYEMTVEQHQELLKTCLECQNAKIVLSSYPNALYDETLKGWRRTEKEVPNNAAGGDTKRRMTECLYLNW
jgi:DNA adenine methylase